MQVNHQDVLCTSLEGLIDDEASCDVRLVVKYPHGDTVIFCHRVILCAMSPFFAAMFNSGMREESSGELILEDIDSLDTLRTMIAYLYTGKTNIDKDNAHDLMVLANRFEVLSLKTACAEYLMQGVNVSNCCYLHSLADTHSCEALQEYCMRYIVKHFDQVSMSSGFLDLPIQVLEFVFLRDELCASREENVFDALLRWVEARGDGFAYEDALGVVDAIRFPLMTPAYLAETVEGSSLAMLLPRMKTLLFEAYRMQAGRKTGVSASPLGLPPQFRIKERGREFLIFGTGEDGERCGVIESHSPSPSSLLHHVQQLYKKDATYWLPLETDETFVTVRFDRVFRVASLKFRNRHSRSFCVSYAVGENGVRGPWSQLVSWSPSGPHREIKECAFSRAVSARWIRIQLTRWPQSSFSPSLFWLEMRGKEQ